MSSPCTSGQAPSTSAELPSKFWPQHAWRSSTLHSTVHRVPGVYLQDRTRQALSLTRGAISNQQPVASTPYSTADVKTQGPSVSVIYLVCLPVCSRW